MRLKIEDRLAIHELMGLHGHLVDRGEFARLNEVFTDDVVYDIEAFGGGRPEGINAIRLAALALGNNNPLGHHVTSVVIVAQSATEANVISKGLGVTVDGTVGSVTYEDAVRLEYGAWRIWKREVVLRRNPLQA